MSAKTNAARSHRATCAKQVTRLVNEENVRKNKAEGTIALATRRQSIAKLAKWAPK